jgi:hypothetical protein
MKVLFNINKGKQLMSSRSRITILLLIYFLFGIMSFFCLYINKNSCSFVFDGCDNEVSYNILEIFYDKGPDHKNDYYF